MYNYHVGQSWRWRDIEKRIVRKKACVFVGLKFRAILLASQVFCKDAKSGFSEINKNTVSHNIYIYVYLLRFIPHVSAYFGHYQVYLNTK
jgi:hypothetical protein